LQANIEGARAWEVETGKEVYHSPPEDDFGISIISPDGKWLIRHIVRPACSNNIRITNLNNMEESKLRADVYVGWDISSDSKYLVASTSEDCDKATEHVVVRIWEISSRKEILTIDPSNNQWGGADSVAFSPDGTLLAIGGRGKFALLSAGAGQQLALETHIKVSDLKKGSSVIYQIVGHVGFSPDGKYVISGGGGGLVKIWSIER
jgi:WD40 repeat protein